MNIPFLLGALVGILILILVITKRGRGLFLFGSIPKSWVGQSALLGSSNPLTSVLRGLLNSQLGRLALMRHSPYLS